jgi:uncharacterized membrane protein
MNVGRVEAFSDGVIAVILTIMVLELKAPENGDLAALLKLKLPILNYLLSFAVIAIFWVNHRTILGLVRHVDPVVLWSNNALLFWMSLVPFATAYMGQTNAAPLSVAVYGGLLAITAGAFSLLRLAAVQQHERDSELHRRHKRLHRKDILGVLLYAASVPLAFVSVRAAFGIFILIPLSYFLPDRLTESNEA